MPNKKPPFAIGDIIRCTKNFTDTHEYWKNELFLVTSADPGDDHPNAIIEVEQDEPDKWSEWMTKEQLKNFEIAHPSPLRPEPKVEVSQENGLFSIGISLKISR